ncbi:MAG: winged helix-turn-helix transcriptional regulator [Planctomycetes bacterium]|nr:winged helix-turn-helix transcriptional regulator [Planctomycetota bacterium]
MANSKQDVQRFLRNAHILARLVERVLEIGYLKQASGDALTFDQVNLLKFLARPRKFRVKDVAHFLNASHPAASKAVSRLARKGAVHLSTDPDDRRAERIRVTPRGQRWVDGYERTKEARIHNLMKGRNPRQLAEGIERVIDALLLERSVVGNPCLGCGAYFGEECVVRAHGQTCNCACEDHSA